MRTIKSATDLQTTKQATVDGFAWQAEAKSMRANEFDEVAEYFRKRSKSIENHQQFCEDPILYRFAVAACSLSRKSLNHLSKVEVLGILRKLIDIEKFNDDAYLQRLEGRYFLTCGDSLGGSMRNVIGQVAQNRLTELIAEHARNRHGRVLAATTKTGKITSLIWSDRTMIFDKKPKFINKSVDLILLAGEHTDLVKAIENPANYLLAGELKGGIDPAGADEHWKTARSALDRINDAFEKQDRVPPLSVFVGAAIEASMAVEIFDRMASANFLAANLTKEDQMIEVVDHITRL